MELLTNEIREKLLANGRANLAAIQADGNTHDFEPVLKLFNPTGAATWLFTELDEDGDRLFGLCDLGMGEPEMGYASLSEIASIKTRFGLGIERDLHFKAKGTLSQYAKAAHRAQHIVMDI